MYLHWFIDDLLPYLHPYLHVTLPHGLRHIAPLAPLTLLYDYQMSSALACLDASIGNCSADQSCHHSDAKFTKLLTRLIIGSVVLVIFCVGYKLCTFFSDTA